MDLHRVCAAPLAHLDKTPLADTLYCFELSAQSRCSLRPEKILKPESKSCCCVRTGAIILSGSWHTHTYQTLKSYTRWHLPTCFGSNLSTSGIFKYEQNVRAVQYCLL